MRLSAWRCGLARVARSRESPGLSWPCDPGATCRIEATEAYDCCVHYRREIEVAAAAEPTFAYLSDFGNAAEWDPGIVEARRLTPAPAAVGSRLELIALFRRRHRHVEYVVTELADGTHTALASLAACLARAV